MQLFRSLTERAARHVRSVRVDGPILEIGCGDRVYLAADTSFERPVIGIDINQDLLKAAKYANPALLLVTGDLEALPFMDSAFAGALSVSVLQYVDHERTLHELARVLSIGAKASFVENLKGSPFARVFRHLHAITGRHYGRFVTPRQHIAWHDCAALFSQEFEVIRIEATNLTTPLSYVQCAMSGYGDRLGRDAEVASVLSALDGFLLRRLPGLARYCWTVGVQVEKRKRHVQPPYE